MFGKVNWTCRCETEEERQEKLHSVYMLAKNGRSGEEGLRNYKKCETLLALFCMKKEKEHTRNGRTSSLIKKGGLSPEEFKELEKECSGKRWAELMPATRRAMLLLMIENNVYKNEDGKYFVYELKYEKNITQERKYTDRKTRSKEGGWSQEGLDRFWEILKRENEDEKRNKREIGTDKMKFDLKRKEVYVEDSNNKRRRMESLNGVQDATIDMEQMGESIEMLSSSDEEEDNETDDEEQVEHRQRALGQQISTV